MRMHGVNHDEATAFESYKGLSFYQRFLMITAVFCRYINNLNLSNILVNCRFKKLKVKLSGYH